MNASVPNCTLSNVKGKDGKIRDMRNVGCINSKCETCGWDEDVSKARQDAIRKNGLTLMKTGLYGLVLNKRKEIVNGVQGKDSES